MMGILSGIVGALTGEGGLGGKIADIIDKRVQDKDLAAKLKQEMDVLVATQAHELAMAAIDAEKAADTEQQETVRAELAQTDEYTKRTRPMLVRRSWWATVAYVFGSVVTQVAGIWLHVQSYMVDWSILTILMAPVLTYFGVRSFDKWKMGK